MRSAKASSVAAHLALLLVVAVWGATFTVVKDSLQDASPLLFNLLRMTLAFLLLAAINHRQLRRVSRTQLIYGTLAGIFLGIGYQFQTVGLAWTSPAKSAFITGLVVVFVPFLAAIPFPGKPVRIPKLSDVAGAVLAFVGLFLLTTPPHTTNADLFHNIGRGDLLTLVCAVAFAAHLLTLDRASKSLDAGLLATLQIGVAALLMTLTLPILPGIYLHLSGRLVLAFLITAVFATAAAFTIQSWAQQHLQPTHTAVLLTMEPVFAWLTSLLFLHENLSRRSIKGAGLILAGIMILELTPILNLSSPRPLIEPHV